MRRWLSHAVLAFAGISMQVVADEAILQDDVQPQAVNLFASADEAFAKRSQGYDQSTQARKLYETALKQSDTMTQADVIYGVSQVARLDLYRGAMIEGVSSKDKESALEGCIDLVSAYGKSMGMGQEYYYYMVSCTAMRGKIAGVLARIKWAIKLKGLEGEALKSTKQDGRYVGGYEAGGILRVMGAVRGNRKAKPLGLYNPDEALEFANIAINTPARVYKPFPKAMSGEDYFENFYYKGMALTALAIEKNETNYVDEAQKVIADTLEIISSLEKSNELPKGREPEIRYYKGEMTKFAQDIEECKSARNWRSCLTKRLD